VAVIAREHTDLDFREQVLDRHGVDMQVLTFPNPGTHVLPPGQAVAGAKLINDALATAVTRRSRRFAALGTLPLNDPAASMEELGRVVQELGFRGVMVLSHVNGVALADERFFRLYEKAEALDAVIYIHPTSPVAADTMSDYRLTSLIGFPTETTLAAARLVFSGVVARFPRIRWVLGNLGGTIPFLAERLDRGVTEHSKAATAERLKTGHRVGPRVIVSFLTPGILVFD
jgi:aminocarboxymuconate-semialdehyde decarboxylase